MKRHEVTLKHIPHDEYQDDLQRWSNQLSVFQCDNKRGGGSYKTGQ